LLLPDDLKFYLSQYERKSGPVWLLDLMSRRRSFDQSSNWIKKLVSMAKSVKEVIL
jgi:hypothetical protein